MPAVRVKYSFTADEDGSNPSPVVTERITSDEAVAEFSEYSNRRQMDLESGINGIIMDTLADGKPHWPKEVTKNLKAGGYAETSTRVTLRNLARRNKILHNSDGSYQKKKTK
jgi:hypothetical protein